MVVAETAALRIAHLTTVDMSLALLLGTELEVDVEAGHEVFGISAPGPYVERVERLGVRHVPITSLTRSWSPRADLRAARELYAALGRFDLDVLHTHNPKTGVLGRVLGRRARVPVVVNTCHGLWAGPEDRWAKKALVYGSEVAAALFSDAELYQNGTDRKTLGRWVRGAKTRVVGNGVDLGRFRPDPGAGRRLRAELGIADDAVVVGGVGRLVAEKGIAEFAAAAAHLEGKAVFVWVGMADPDKADAFDTSAVSQVRWLGERSDMAAVYAMLDVFVLASYREGFSRSGMEAAACGAAMVLSDIRGCREIGRDERELLLVPPGDAGALAAAVERLLLDPGLRRALGSAAAEYAAARFDQRAIARVSLDTYAAVAAHKGLW